MMHVICLIFVFCLHKSAANRFSMPVLVVDGEHVLYGINVPENPFHKMSPMTFSEILRNAIQRSERILLFIEDHFSVEDVSTKDKLGTPYYYLHQGVFDHKAMYIPSVVEPFRTIKHMFPPQESNVFYLSNTLKSFDSNFKYYYIFFQDQGFNETRVEKLRRHDKIMRTVCLTVRQLSPGPVVAFYTGKANPMLQMGNIAYFPQQLPPVAPPPPVNLMIVTDGALFRLSESSDRDETATGDRDSDTCLGRHETPLVRGRGALFIRTRVYSTAGARRTLQTAPTVAEQVMSRRRLMTRMLYSDFELEFDFLYRRDGWTLDTVSLLEGGEEVGRTRMDAGAPWGVSYYCAAPLVIVNTRDQSAVIVSTYQIEPLLSKKFGHEFRRQDDEDPEAPAPEPEPAPDAGGDAPPPAEGGDAVPDAGGGSANDSDVPTLLFIASAAFWPKDVVFRRFRCTMPQSQSKTGFSETKNCQPYFNAHILAGLMVAALVLTITMYGVVTMFNCHTNSRFEDPNSKPLVIVAQL
ncbi:hypothetical protein MSG28_014704 [Choristoneura fumiferana]|uniref:Uncharacterized protein n=1 Tax=Choristoneura fumiferana TaxID=7141 RepID=A0ACC0JSM2_CHOFU|nr:hypothetical protein MSG28_014704 [Choristoneura fumiferana]